MAIACQSDGIRSQSGPGRLNKELVKKNIKNMRWIDRVTRSEKNKYESSCKDRDVCIIRSYDTSDAAGNLNLNKFPFQTNITFTPILHYIYNLTNSKHSKKIV